MKPKFIKVHFMGHSKNGVKHCDINGAAWLIMSDERVLYLVVKKAS